MTDFNLFLPLTKVEKQKDGSCVVAGYASTEALDLDGEVVSRDAIKAALPDYWEWRNIREMHRPSAVGIATKSNLDDRGLFLTAKIVDREAVQKCLDGVYKGFSIGGRKLAKSGNTITEIEWVETSIVDRPANPECKFELAKRAKDSPGLGWLMKARVDRSPIQRVLAKMAQVVETLAKDGPPAAHDGFSLPAPVKCAAHGVLGCAKCAKAAKKAKKAAGVAEPSPLDAEPGQARKGGDTPGKGKKPYGNVTYADPGYQSDKKERYPIDTEDHIRAAWSYINKPKNAGRYSPENLATVKSRIKAAMKRIGAEVKKKKIKKRAKLGSAAMANFPSEFLDLSRSVSAEPSFLTLGADPVQTGGGLAGPGHDGFSLERITTLRKDGTLPRREIRKALEKRMGIAGSLSYCFDQIRDAQRSLLVEAKREGGDQKDAKLAKQLGNVAKELAAVIGQKAIHEGAEALDLSDADDQGLNLSLGESNMTLNAKASKTDQLSLLLQNLAKAGRTPTRAQRLADARGNLKKARKTASDLEECIKAAHGMLRKAYLAKAALIKAGKKTDPDAVDDVDTMSKVMGELNKAYGAATSMKTFMKAASGQLKKAASRSGQRGQEAGDPEAGFYEVPAGVKDLSPADLAGAAPGTTGGGSQPPLYPGDGSIYPGKAARKLAKVSGGLITPQHAEAMARAAAAEARLELVGKMPMGSGGGRRPYAFDVGKFAGAGGTNGSPPGDPIANAIAKSGVAPAALMSEHDQTRDEARAKVAGTYILGAGRSMFDPSFHGTAGVGRGGNA